MVENSNTPLDFFQNSLEVMALALLKAGAKAPVPSFARYSIFYLDVF
jgi:hypothetical protein